MSKQSLGSVFDEVPQGPVKGKDLTHRVVVPPAAAGRRDGVRVAVPRRLMDDDGHVVQRAVNPADDGDTIVIHVPVDTPAPMMLRLRGMGGVTADGVPGDLFLRVEFGDVPALSAPSPAPAVFFGVGGAIAVVAAILGLFVAC